MADLVDLEHFGLDPDDDLVELAESVADAVDPGLDLEHVIVLDFESQIYSLDLGSLGAVYLECFVVLVCFAAAFEELRNAIM